MKIIKCLLLFSLTFLYINCAIMEGAGRLFDGSVCAEKRVSLYRASIKKGAVSDTELKIVRNKEGNRSLIISFKKYSMMKLRGSLPNEEGIFHLTSLEFLAGNAHGWNEYSMQITGTGRLTFEDGAVLEYIKEIEPIQITSGRIHRYDTRMTGNDALIALRNRNDRITSLAEWMLSLKAPKDQEIKIFEKYWMPVFFPEMASKKNRPLGWKEADDQFVKAEDIRWNTGYTERVFPEELHLVRNSGTLLRDWEEALYWIYMEYEWNNIMELFNKEIIFQKIK